MTTTEKNEIIARFMGYIDNGCSNDGFLIHPETNYDEDISELKYHSDWNWLCLVIEKIELMSHTGFMGTVQMFGLGRTRINCYQSEILRKEIDIIGERYGINPTHE
ncbi:MAG: hypothetical protein IPP05_22385, partial [Cytophagaceae bacterium]|nr:hypothetical protein [Cytophagaceae bacterium]